MRDRRPPVKNERRPLVDAGSVVQRGSGPVISRGPFRRSPIGRGTIGAGTVGGDSIGGGVRSGPVRRGGGGGGRGAGGPGAGAAGRSSVSWSPGRGGAAPTPPPENTGKRSSGRCQKPI